MLNVFSLQSFLAIYLEIILIYDYKIGKIKISINLNKIRIILNIIAMAKYSAADALLIILDDEGEASADELSITEDLYEYQERTIDCYNSNSDISFIVNSSSFHSNLSKSDVSNNLQTSLPVNIVKENLTKKNKRLNQSSKTHKEKKNRQKKQNH